MTCVNCRRIVLKCQLLRLRIEAYAGSVSKTDVTAAMRMVRSGARRSPQYLLPGPDLHRQLHARPALHAGRAIAELLAVAERDTVAVDERIRIWIMVAVAKRIVVAI